MSQIRAVIYDCDGVIVDSTSAIISYYSWLSEKCGIDCPDWSDIEIKNKILSYTETDIINILSNNNELLKEKMYNVIKTEQYSGGFDDITLEDTLKDGLEILRKKNIKLAVDTNRGASLPYLLEHFNIKEYFSFWVTSRDVEKPKPHPEGVFKICNFLNVLPDEVLFIGDSMADYMAGKSSGVKFIAYKNKLNDAPIIYDHKDIINFL